MKRFVSICLCAILIIVVAGTVQASKFTGKKVLFVDSYHEGYAWSDGITNGVKGALEGSGYGFPTRNITGMVEVNAVDGLIIIHNRSLAMVSE
jgi:hypothetical protein